MNALIIDPVVYTENDREIEGQILSLVKQNREGIVINAVLNNLDKKHDSFIIKEVLWRLISSGKISLTSERKLTVPS